MKKNLKSEFKIYSYLVWCASLITIIMTPWTNSDSLIIPKLIVLFCLACFLIPFLIISKKFFFYSKIGKIVIFLVGLIALQLILVLVISPAPLEQSFFGRTGRGLGFSTEISLLVVLMMASISVKQENLKSLQLAILVSCFATSTYSVLQKFGLDVFEWTTRTNGIIGTLGNPNFQSSFAALSFILAGVYFWEKRWGKVTSAIVCIPSLILIYISESTQGYLILLASVSVFSLIYFWYRKKIVFSVLFLTFVTSTIVAILGMLNKGPMADYLYKVSIQSRGDFFRTSVTIANNNPFFGVGLDALGDNYLKYIDFRTANSIGEFTDNSHNLFLNYAVSGGYLLALLQYSLSAIVVYCFIKNQILVNKFHAQSTAIFCAWISYQLQALISPANISMLTWNSIFSGSLIGLYLRAQNTDRVSIQFNKEKIIFVKPFSYLFLILGFVTFYPLYKVDHMQVIANKTGNANLALQSALAYPESVIRYSRIGQDLLRSNLLPQALELGRAAVKFNPNAPSAWGLILINPQATFEERQEAKNEIMRLDPYNKDIKSFNLPDQLNKQ